MKNEVNGIYPMYEAFYIQSMLFITDSAMRSIHLLNKFLEQCEGEDFVITNPERMLNQIQNIVLQCGALSRYFWPSRPGHDDRAKQLRNAFNINDDNPLHDRDLRNAIEHFDERLDVYLSKGIVGHIIPQFVGFSSENEPEVPMHVFRAYYLDRMEFQLLNSKYMIEPLVEEMCRMHELLLKFDSDGGRFKAHSF